MYSKLLNNLNTACLPLSKEGDWEDEDEGNEEDEEDEEIESDDD